MRRTEYDNKVTAMKYIKENDIQEATIYTDVQTGKIIVEAIIKA